MNKITKRAAVFAAIMFVALPTVASDVDGFYSVLGMSSSCGKFIGVVDKRKQNDSDWGAFADYHGYVNWTLGYLSAFNAEAHNTYDILGDTDVDGMKAFVEKYCRENPLKGYTAAVEVLVYELFPNRKQNKD